MKDFKLVKKVALYSVATVMCVAGQSVWAHTGIRDSVTEGVPGYNAFTVTHGCASNAVAEGSPVDHQNVIAMSVLFPNAADPAKAKIYKLNSNGVQIESLPDLAEHIDGIKDSLTNAISGFTKMGIGLVTGGGTLFANIIPTVDTTLDANGNKVYAIRGFRTWAGPKPLVSAPLEESIVSATGLAPFKHGAIKFLPTSCAKSLKIRVAVANWCRSGPTSKNLADRVDVWIGHTTAKFHDQATMPRATPYDAATEKVFWPTMTVYRNIAGTPATATSAAIPANPLLPECNGGFDLAIEPSDDDIDALLPIPNKPYPQGAPGAKYFP